MGGQPQSPDLLGIGTHCDFVGCNQLAFLPFSCSSCGSMFCGEHRFVLAYVNPLPRKVLPRISLAMAIAVQDTGSSQVSQHSSRREHGGLPSVCQGHQAEVWR